MSTSPTTQGMRALIFNGQPAIAQAIYGNFVETGSGSAETHLAGFMAVRDLGADEEALLEIQRRAQECADYADVEEYFTDEWLVFNALVRHQQ